MGQIVTKAPGAKDGLKRKKLKAGIDLKARLRKQKRKLPRTEEQRRARIERRREKRKQEAEEAAARKAEEKRLRKQERKDYRLAKDKEPIVTEVIYKR